VLARLGYATQLLGADDPFKAVRLNAAFLAFLGTFPLPEEVTSTGLDMEACEDKLFALLAFARRLDAEFLSRANLSPAEARALLDSLAEFTRNHAAWLTGRLESTRCDFGDGASYFFRLIRDMRQSRHLP